MTDGATTSAQRLTILSLAAFVLVILQALTAGHFDSIALECMDAAQHALAEATSQIKSDIREVWLANAKLSDSDRAAITVLVDATLQAFKAVP